MIGDGEAEVEDRDDDRHLVPRDQQPHQPCLEHVGREEGEEHDDQREHQTHVLDTERRKSSTKLSELGSSEWNAQSCTKPAYIS